MLASNIIYTILIASATTLAGIPLTYKLKTDPLTKTAHAFCLGYTLTMLAGITANHLNIDTYITQIITVASLITAGIILNHKKPEKTYTKKHLTVLSAITLYIIIALYLQSQHMHWMAGDATTHATQLRMLLDGEKLPIKIYPFGSYWEYYPKGFHHQSLLPVKLLGMEITKALKILPTLITAVSSLLIYAIVKKQSNHQQAVYAMIIATFCFIPHYAYLIWGGYPTATGQMLMLAAILAATDYMKKHSPIYLLIYVAGITFAHTRFLLYLTAILLPLLFWSYKQKIIDKKTYLTITVSALIASAAVAVYVGVVSLNPTEPEFIKTLLTDQEITLKYLATMIFFPLAIPGFITALYRRNNLDILSIGWLLSTIALVIVVDCNILTLPIKTDRVLSKLYLPLSILASYSLYCIQKEKQKIKAALTITLLLIGLVFTYGVFHNYNNKWGMPQPDYQAITWIKQYENNNTIVINLDATGRWIYPITRIPITGYKNRKPKPELNKITKKMINNPEDKEVLNELNNSSREYKHILIYISNTTTTHPHYQPPFLRFGGDYPSIETKKFQQDYRVVYNQSGSLIYEYVPS